MLKTKKLNAVIALEIILSMILYYFVLIGYTAITYAIDLVETNNHNVDFTAYFMDENGEKTDIVERDINSKQYLYIDVSVKNEGYFNGTIKIENSNFRIENEILSSNISEILDNEIHLNQINAGTTETIKVAVKAIQQETIQYSKFNTKTDIILNGQYVNSKNVEKEQLTEVNGKTQVEIKWVSGSASQINLSVDTLTNSIFKVNEEDKRVLQLLINSKLNNNDYPIKNTLISLNAPNGTEKTDVFARSTDSTNAQKAFNSNNYIYDNVNNKLNINLVNDDIENISWKKDSIDSFVVTFTINKDQDIKDFIANIDVKLTLYDDRELTLNKSVNINENIDKIVSNDIETKENSIYKGKLYTGEEREYSTTSNINVNFKSPVEKITFKEDVSKFISGENEINANIIYKNTSINKQNFLSILGENGYITVKNENGTIIANINNNTEINENGDIVLNYVGGEKSLIFETSKPISEGVLKVNNTKAILNTGLTREEINNLSGIKETTLNLYNDNNNLIQGQKIIELKNTTTKANFNVNTESLTSMEKNENVKMEVVLENTNESMDLFQNPTIKITLPKQVKEISAKCKLMFGNGLELGTATINKDGENNFIEISLVGTQASYNTEVVNGTTILLYADIALDKLIENSNEEIKLNYTNELASNYADNGEIKKNIKIDGLDKETIQRIQEEEKARALAENAQISDGIKSSLKAYVGGQEIKEGDTVYTGEIVKYELTLENVGEEDIENVNIEANVPEGTRLVERIINEKLEEKYMIKQTENNIVNKTIEKINHLDNNKITMQYEVKVDENTEVASILNKIRINSDTINIENELSNNIQKNDISLVTLMHIRHSEIVNNADEYSYYINVKNIGNKDLNNIPVSIITNSAYKLIKIVDDEDYQPISDKNQFEIENLPAGQSKTYIVEVIVDKGNQNNASIYAIANNKSRSNYCSERIQSIELVAHLDSDNKDQSVSNENDIVYNLDIENNGDVSQNNLYIKQMISNYYDVKEVKLNGENIEFNKDYNNQFEGGDNENYYYIEYAYLKELRPGERISIKVTIQAYDIEYTENININSYAIINGINTETVTHILEKNKYDDLTKHLEESDEEISDNEYVEDPNVKEKDDNGIPDSNEMPNGNNNPNGSTDENNTIDNKNYSISGKVWLDENQNGQRDLNEKHIDNIQITLLNVEANNIQKINNNGSYKFTNLSKGKYIVIFEYDANKYNLTKYQAENVSKDLNSDVEKNKITFEGKEQVLAITDILNITNEDITNIDLGLVIAKNFDLELIKTISKITISNTEGTSVKEYNNTTLAKIEIGAKYLKNSTVVIEYNIKVKNTGEIAGYAQQITDYKPTDLKFNSSLNSSWYQSGEYLYSNALEKTKIEPGETKEIKLVLTKEMTEFNTGLTNNMAEINKSIGMNNTNDSDSIFGNKKSGEDDLGQANAIIGIKTGATISYICISILIIVATAMGGYFINKIALKIDD